MKKILFWALLCLPLLTLQAQKKEVVVTLNEKQAALNAKTVSSISALFHPKATLQKFPKEKLAEGVSEVQAYYTQWFSNKETVTAKLLDRIAFKGMIIDKEQIETSNGTMERIVFYKFKKNKIKTMTILEAQPEAKESNARFVVEKQLAAYNRRNIEDFVKTYSEDVKIYNFPGRLKTEGHSGLRRDYTDWFASARDLNCQIKKRMVMGGIVIDHEAIIANGNSFQAVAIYHVENGRIKSVNFIQ
ncbi:MAG: nuclear transport factor 2 family protein [Bacteroidota bacterium]